MKEYHKIQTVFLRDPETKYKTLLATPSLPEFSYLWNNEWEFTEKVDGTNIRVMYADGAVTLGGKTDNAQIPARLVTRLHEVFSPGRLLAHFDGVDVCLYGEGHGAKTQKGGGNYSPTQEFTLFDVRIGDVWLERKDVEDIANKMECSHVPVIGRGTLHQMVEMASSGFNSKWGDFPAEGIVARPAVTLVARNGSRIITKIKLKDFR